MSKREPAMVLNMNDLDTKRRLMGKIGKLSGLWEVSLRQRKRTRSLNQNAYYFAAFVGPFREWLCENWGETFDTDQAHTQLKIAVLGTQKKVNKGTGEEIEIIPASRFKDTWEFTEYLEKAAEFLARACGIVVLPSEMYFEQPINTKETKSHGTSISRAKTYNDSATRKHTPNRPDDVRAGY